MYDTSAPLKSDLDAEAAQDELNQEIFNAIRNSEKYKSMNKIMEDLDNAIDALGKMYKKDKQTDEYVSNRLEGMQEAYDTLESELDFMVTTESPEYKEIDENY